MHKMWKKRRVKNRTATLLTSNAENVKAFIILRTIVSQRHTYNKEENIALKKKKKKAHTKPEKKAHTNFTMSRIRNEKM